MIVGCLVFVDCGSAFVACLFVCRCLLFVACRLLCMLGVGCCVLRVVRLLLLFSVRCLWLARGWFVVACW